MASTTPKPCPDPPSPLYHSSYARLAAGDVLVPGRDVGRGRGQWVWMDANPSSWPKGWLRRGDEDEQHTYEVEPLDEVQIARGYWRTKRAKVVREITREHS